MSKSTVIMVIGALLLGGVAFMVYEEMNKSPVEKAAEDVGKAIDNVADEISDNN